MTGVAKTLISPWAWDAPELLTRSMTHLAYARVVLPDGEVFPLDLTGGTVSWDETRAPRVSARVSCKVPNDQALLDRLDPRTGARLVIEAGYRREDGLDDVQTLCDLSLRSRSVSRPSDQMVLEGASDESLLIDNSPSNGGSVSASNTIDAIKSVVQMIFPGLAFDVDYTFSVSPGPAVSQSPLGDKWTVVNDLADRIEAQVYDDGLRTWHIDPPPSLTSYVALSLAVGSNGTVITSNTGLSRDEGWFNRVFLTYEWTDSSDVDHKVVSVRSVTTGYMAAVTGNIRTLELKREVPTTQTQADAAAAALVRRTVTRGRSFEIGAISAYWLRPGHTVEIALPLGDPEKHLVTAVEFDLAGGDMTVTTRLPDGTYTIGA